MKYSVASPALTSSSVQFSRSVVSDCLQPHEPQHARPPLSITNSRSSPKPMSIELVIPSNYLILCHPLLSCPQSFPASGSLQMSQLFASGGQSIGVSASTSVHPGLISFRLVWLDLLAVQGTLKSLLQHHSSKALVLQHSAFFMIQISHSYMTTGNTIASTICTFVGKVMSLIFNLLSRFCIAFLQRSKHLLISWLQSPSAVILEPKKIKFVTVSIVSPSISHEVMGYHGRYHDLSFLNVEL